MALSVPGYESVAQLSRGPTGTVMSGRDAATGTAVAIKFLPPDLVDRMRVDAVVLEGIEHPNVAQVYELVDNALITELIDGGSLRRLLEETGPLEPEAALYVLRGALLGLGEAHGRGILHRDVRPDNILIDAAGVIKVVDIGVAVRARRSPFEGDPRYAAPELRSEHRATPATDVYAAAATLFECLAGRPPRSGNVEAEVVVAGPNAFRDGLPSQLRAVLTAGLAPDPDTRLADADALLDDLDRAATSAYGLDWEDVGKAYLGRRMGPVLTGPPSRHRARAGWASKRAIGTAVAVLVGAVATIAAVGGAFAIEGAPPAGVPTMSHEPIPVSGPTVPVPSATGADTTLPSTPTAVRVTGRSQTAVSLDWNPSLDNDKVAGYLVTRDGQPAGTSYEPGLTVTGLVAKTRYEFTVTAFDPAGNKSPASAAVVATTLSEPDVSPPTVPSGLRTTGQSTDTIGLAWNPSTDNVGVAGYDVFRDGARIASVVRPNYTDRGLSPASSHTYSTRAYDTANNASVNGPAITVTTLTAPDTMPPTTPTGPVATPTGMTSVSVTWNASTDNVGVMLYRVLRDGVLITTTATTGYSDEGLAADTTYGYSIVAVDAAGNASPPSASATAHTDAPPVPPAEVTGLSIGHSAISAPDCSTTVSATVTASGAMTVTLTYDVDGNGGLTTVEFTGAGSQTVTLGTVDVGDTGSASVTHAASGRSANTGWSAPSGCGSPPTTQPPPPDPTGPTT